ncbi:MAG: hypothetical protein WBQ76_14725 [Candidatus Korobacteraceae bacterium]
MALSKTQEAFITKLRAVGNSELGVALDDPICCYLIGIIAADLGLARRFPEIPRDLPPFFGKKPLNELRVSGIGFVALFERLVGLRKDADAYFYCLATLHKARLKYERILQAQPIPTVEQVGPRGLLQFGSLSPAALAGLLLWRKWVYDIDNRAAQETGYVFEPIIAHAIGGVPAGAKNSPVKRQGKGSGRQVDCIRESDKSAYEIKLRVTIAASGQGRWGEELEFPESARASGYTPVLVVLDSTPNPKLKELCEAFKKQKGKTYVGPDAWKHLQEKAGATMARFLDTYVLKPLKSLLEEAPDAPERVPDLLLKSEEGRIIVQIGDEKMEIRRDEKAELGSGADELPPDAANHLPTP